MPELPEVETVRKYLENTIINHKIIDVSLSSKKSLRNVPEKRLNELKGQKITSIDRKAKHLIINFTNHYLILHLRMEGKLFVFNNIKEVEESTKRLHDIITFTTDKGIILFQDTRRFATVDMFEKDLQHNQNPVLIKVAEEPFDMDGKQLFERIKNKRTMIKPTLLDQSIISGLGNIYVDEVLHACKLHPETISNEIAEEKCDEIIKASRRILKKAIELKGTSIRSYTSQYKVEGGYQDFLKVHQQKICGTCGNEITKIKVGGRGTFICKKCLK